MSMSKQLSHPNKRQTSHTRQEHAADFKFDIVASHKNRVVWLHKDEKTMRNTRIGETSPFASEVLIRPNIQPITQICEGDTIEFAINYFN